MEPEPSEREREPANASSQPFRQEQCYAWGHMGHIRRDCPLMECDISWEVHPSGRVQSDKPPPLTVPVRIGQKTVTALLDTGSTVSLILAHLVPQDQPILHYSAVAGV